MFSSLKYLCLAATVLLTACAHPIKITPQLGGIDRKGTTKIEKNAGYFISDVDRSKEVNTPGGGGDSVDYYPYKDLEPALQKVLSNLFKRVYKLDAANDQTTIQEKGIEFVFAPSITTNSSSSGILTWTPTEFFVTVECQALNPQGEVVWESKVVSEGRAVTSELMGDMNLAATRATLDAFQKLQAEINSAEVFRR